jgi:hypothetical protein
MRDTLNSFSLNLHQILVLQLHTISGCTFSNLTPNLPLSNHTPYLDPISPCAFNKFEQLLENLAKRKLQRLVPATCSRIFHWNSFKRTSTFSGAPRALPVVPFVSQVFDGASLAREAALIASVVLCSQKVSANLPSEIGVDNMRERVVGQIHVVIQAVS